MIWDSRVSTSVICRLERLFVAEGLSTVPYGDVDIPFYLEIMDNGLGGTRPRKLSLNWHRAVGDWRSQLVGSEFINKVCEFLNYHLSKYPKPFGLKQKWTMREVEQVLFMDGY